VTTSTRPLPRGGTDFIYKLDRYIQIQLAKNK
jgi:hypothetical protein